MTGTRTAMIFPSIKKLLSNALILASEKKNQPLTLQNRNRCKWQSAEGYIDGFVPIGRPGGQYISQESPLIPGQLHCQLTIKKLWRNGSTYITTKADTYIHVKSVGTDQWHWVQGTVKIQYKKGLKLRQHQNLAQFNHKMQGVNRTTCCSRDIQRLVARKIPGWDKCPKGRGQALKGLMQSESESCSKTDVEPISTVQIPQSIPSLLYP